MAGDNANNNVAHQLIDKFYTAPDAKLLSQGDILCCEKLSANLIGAHAENVTKDVYPYFFGKYKYAIVLNADCDLFSNDEDRSPKIKCMQIAAVEEASEHIKSLLQINQTYFKTRLIDEKRYEKVATKFESLINQQEKVYFYIPENLNIGFKSAYVARLDTSVSVQINSKDKYAAILKSRLPASVDEPYKSKLGEKIAELFDRTGLTDVQDILDDYVGWRTAELQKYFLTVKDYIYRRAKKDALTLANSMSADDPGYASKLAAIIEKHSEQPKEDFEDLPAYRALKRIITGRLAGKAGVECLNNIMNDNDIKSAFISLNELADEE